MHKIAQWSSRKELICMKMKYKRNNLITFIMNNQITWMPQEGLDLYEDDEIGKR